MEAALRKKLKGGKFSSVTPGNSRRMSAIRSRGNKSTEGRLRAALVSAGIRGWHLDDRSLPGRPDFVFPEQGVVVFVDGCYWHACPKCGHVPNVNRPYWSEKLERNKARDKKNTNALREQGYTVLRFWEHEIAQELSSALVKIEIALDAK